MKIQIVIVGLCCNNIENYCMVQHCILRAHGPPVNACELCPRASATMHIFSFVVKKLVEKRTKKWQQRTKDKKF